MTVLGIDWGLKKVGLATADDRGVAFTPQPIYLRPQSPQIWSLTAADKKALLSFKDQWEITKVVLGNPTLSDDTPAEVKKAFDNFRRKLAELLGVPIECENEALSSWQAQDMRAKNKSIKGDEDSLAALVILQAYFERHS